MGGGVGKGCRAGIRSYCVACRILTQKGFKVYSLKRAG